MNQQLYNLYCAAVAELDSALPPGAGVSRPLLLYVPDAYHAAAFKLMIVGQETNGWCDPGDTVDTLIGIYCGFNLGQKCYRSPFWQAAHRIYRGLNPQGPERAFLWSNLVKVDQNGRRPESAVEEAVSRLGLLPAEISITQPDVVVFFTGPFYDDRLRSTFRGLTLNPGSAVIARVEHPDLPVHSYRTYHPGYLRRSRQWHVLDELVSRVRNG
jgi:hypothetical protein